MNRKQFRNAHYEQPAENGTYQWKMKPGYYIPVTWLDGEWYTKSGDSLGTAVVLWR